MIHPDLLRTFAVLAEEKHFSRTATRLHMTQPGVSQHLKKLEEHFATTLLVRDGKQVHLTEAGRRLLEHAHAQARDYERLRTTIGADDPHAGRARFAAPGSFGLPLYDAMLSAMRKHPGLRLEITVMPAPQIAARVAADEIDVGFTTERPADPGLEAESFVTERLVLAIPKAYRGHTLKDLTELGFVHHPDGPALAARLMAPNFADFEGTSRIPTRTSINQISRILDPVAEGLGFTVVPEFTLTRYARRKEVKTLPLRREVRDTVFKVTRKGEKLPARFATVETEIRRQT